MRSVLALVCLAASGLAPSAPRFYVTGVGASLVDERLASAAPTGSDAAAFEEVPPPGIGARRGQAQATEAPWLDSNGWRFERGLRKANYAKLPAGAAPLAAAEAFVYGAEAILNPDPADIEELGRMLRFLTSQPQSTLPLLANVAVVDDRSVLMGELLNMLTRRNLLYRVVSAPDRTLPTVQIGTAEFPREAARNPSDFAARVREKIGDDNRLVRVYGSSTVIARLTGDRTRARLSLVAYATNRRRSGGRNQQHVRIRLLGRYQPSGFAAYGAATDAGLMDVETLGNVTEFSVPPFSTLALVHLTVIK